MKLWIVGAHGLVGRALASLAKARGIDVIATGRAEADITSLERLKRFSHQKECADVTHIINCAAFTDVDGAEKAPELAAAVNSLGPENLGFLAAAMNARLLHISTDYVFGDAKERKPLTETDPCAPTGVYATTKWEGENRLLDAFPSACIVRTSWVFGQGGRNFISSLLPRMQKEEKISASTDQTSSPTFATDLAKALLAMLCHSGIYHFANGGEASRFDLAREMHDISRLLGIPLMCQAVAPVTGLVSIAKRPTYSVLSTQKIGSLLGEPPRHWRETVIDYLQKI
jgi:dTDP-4-dehydrorhamnose reductase